jgi:UDP-glucose:tetrahydrobiopterin glucosyltransferase
MGSLLDGMDAVIEQTVSAFPGSVAMHTQAQAETFSFADRCRIIGNGLELERYRFNPAPEPRLAWIGRVAPEKGLEDALAAAGVAELPLDVMGIIEDATYWHRVRAAYPGARLYYHGFLETRELVEILRRCKALLMTPKWTEAFGNVVMEALACGVPVIAYRRGGPAEMIEDGRTGFLVEPDDVSALTQAIGKVHKIDRQACRSRAEQSFSLDALGARLEHWFATLITTASTAPPSRTDVRPAVR